MSLPFTSFSQNWDDEDGFYVSTRQGLEFGVNLGVYRAHPNSSSFYVGDGWFDLGDNQANLYSIEDRLFLGTTEDQINNTLNLGGGNFWIPDVDNCSDRTHVLCYCLCRWKLGNGGGRELAGDAVSRICIVSRVYLCHESRPGKSCSLCFLWI